MKMGNDYQKRLLLFKYTFGIQQYLYRFYFNYFIFGIAILVIESYLNYNWYVLIILYLKSSFSLRVEPSTSNT